MIDLTQLHRSTFTESLDWKHLSVLPTRILLKNRGAPRKASAGWWLLDVDSLVEICKPAWYNATRALAAVSDPWYGVRCRSEGKRQAQALSCLLLLPNLPPGPGKRAANGHGDPQKQKRASPKARPLNPSNSKGRTNLNSERMNLSGS